MSLKVRMKSYSFWVSLASAILLVLKVIGQSLGFSVDESLYNDIFTALCGILVICGIIAPPTGKEGISLQTSVNQKALLSNINTNTQQNDNVQEENTEPKNENLKEDTIINNEDNLVTEDEISKEINHDDIIQPMEEPFETNDEIVKDFTEDNAPIENNTLQTEDINRNISSDESITKDNEESFQNVTSPLVMDIPTTLEPILTQSQNIQIENVIPETYENNQ